MRSETKSQDLPSTSTTQEYWYRCSTVLEPQEAFAIYLRADHTWQETPFGRELSGGPNSQHNLHSRSCSRVTSKVQGSCWATGTRPRNHSDQLVDSHTRNVVQRMIKETKQNTKLADFGWAWILSASCGACGPRCVPQICRFSRRLLARNDCFLTHEPFPCFLMRHGSCATNLVAL